jgi:hypothetical protein
MEILAERLVLRLLPADADPRRTRPPERVSSVLTCLATRVGWRCGSTSTSVPSVTRVVTAAMYESTISASRIGICGGYGPGGRSSIG